MSLDLLCTGDTIIPQTETGTTGEAFGTEYSYTDGTALDCLVQSVGAAESAAQGTRGQRTTYNLFFTSNPGLTQGKRLKWTHHAGVALSAPVFLRVLDQYDEGRPAEAQWLWVVDAQEDTTRREA
jgi:hypothetical protein